MANKEAMEAICKAVKENNADFGIIFDTDVDRSSAVDANGKEIIAIASPRTFSESSICISATGIATVEKAE